MRRFIFMTFLGTTVAAIPVLAQQPKAPTPAQAAQQQRMTTCNADASQRSLKAAARQSFISACLTGKMNQTTLMKVCNAQASQDKLSSAARKTYVSSCLSKSG